MPLSAATWTVNVRSYGLTRESVSVDEQTRLSMFHTDVSFLNDLEIVGTFVASGALHAVVLDAVSGKVLRQASWPSGYESIGLVVRPDGSIVAFLGDRLIFYAPDFAPQLEYKLTPPDDLASDGIWFSHSATGKTILIQYRSANRTSCVWVTGQTVSGQHEPCDVSNFAAVSDGEAATHARDGIFIKEFDGGTSRKLCQPGGWAACSRPGFVTENSLLLWPGQHNTFRMVRDDGKTLFSGISFGWNPWSENGHLLAIADYGRAETGGTPSFAAALVYDIAARKRVFQIKNDKKDGIRVAQGLAISPSGDRLALEGDGVLRCYGLPPRREQE